MSETNSTEKKPRNAYGDGSIRTRKDGRLEKRISLGKDHRGKYIRKSIYATTPRELQRKARQAIRDFQANQLRASERTTVGRFFEEWLKRKAGEVAPRTRANYESDYERYIEPGLAAVKLAPETLTVDVILDWHSDLQERHGAYTANRARNLLRNALGDAVLRRHLPDNPAKGVRAAKHDPGEIDILTADELSLFLEASKRSRLRNMFHLALAAGLRHGEAAALQWNRVKLYKHPMADGDAGELTINQAVITGPNFKQSISVPKRHSIRKVGLTVDAAEALREQRELLRIEGQGSSRLVFPTSTGGLQNGSNTARAMNGVIDACNPRLMDWVYERRAELRAQGYKTMPARNRAWLDAQKLPHFEDLLDVPYVSFHDLRHTFASMMIAAGMDVARLSRLLGHQNPAFTLRVYVRLFHQQKQPAMPSITDFLKES